MADFEMGRSGMPGGLSGDDDPADDELLLRVRATLAPLPQSDPRAVARILAAVHGREPTGWRLWKQRLSSASWTLLGGSGVAAAALATFVIMSRTDGSDPLATPPTVAAAAADTPVRGSGLSTQPIGIGPAPVTVASDARDPEAPLPVQFVLDAASARSVSVVGDFNEWDTSAAPMHRLPGGSIWTITLPVAPGRHTYSFVIDGTRWIADPRAPRAPDSDFGTAGSVLLVNAP